MSSDFGGQSMVASLGRVLVRRPDAAFAGADPDLWHYSARPDLVRAQTEHDSLVETLQRAGAEVVYHDEAQPERADAIYVFDPVLITDRGVVVLRMGKELRRGEEAALSRRLVALGLPILFELVGTACAEGGDLLWLDRQTLVVGVGFRTNHEGLRQLRAGLAGSGVEVLGVDLPYHAGPAACLHLLSLISLVAEDLAVVYRPLLAVSLWQELERRSVRVISVPEDEFATMAANVLALAPHHCLMLEGNPITRRRLEQAGCLVATYRGQEISLKAEGGPTCLTLPLLRAR